METTRCKQFGNILSRLGIISGRSVSFQNTCLKFLIAEGNNGGALHFMKKYSDHYTVTAVTDASRSVYDKLIELRRSGFDFPTEKSFKPAVGDVVLAQSPSQEGMCRARIVSESWGSYRTMLLDCGIIENVTDMRKLPPYLAALPTFAVKCVITSYHVEEEEFLSKCAKSEDAFIFQVMSVKDNQVTCLVLSILNIPLCSVVLSTWQPGLEEVGISCVALRDGDPVRMSFFSGPENVFVTSLVPEHMQQFSTFSDTLHAYCLQAGCLQQPPRVGDLFAHKYVDDNKFYRCQVLSVTGSFCDIFYIDFGDSEFGVLCDKLKYISEDLKKFPCQCLQVCLKDVGSCKMTFGLIHFIKKLVDESTVLLMEKHPDGVILQTEKGISVNETIVTILDNVNDTTDAAADTSAPNSSVECKLVSNTTKNSSTARPPVTSVQSSVIQNHLPDHKHDLNKRIVSSALKHRTFPIGELKLCILSILKDLSLMACPCDPSAAEAVENLTGSLNDYCSIRPVEPYYPQVDEVCIAKFHADGLWYRAVCLVANPNISTRKMIFVDYGNVEDIEVDGIRRMEPQFLELPVLVEKCNIEGVDARNKLVEKIVRETIFTNRLYNVRITKHLSTHYVMDIPQVTVALRAEGLC